MIRAITGSISTTRALGLDISSTMIKAAEVTFSREGLILNRAVVKEVRNNEISQPLKTIVAESGFKTKQVALGLSSPQIVVQPFQFPKMPNEEMVSAIQLEAEHAILNGHEPSQIIVDWHLLNDASDGVRRGILAVIPKEVLSAGIDTVKAAGLKPSIVDVKGLALWNAYWTLVEKRKPSSRTTLILNVDSDATNLVIVRSPDTLILSRDIQLGADSFQNNKDRWLSELHDSLVYARSKGGLRTLEDVLVTGLGANEILPALEVALGLNAKLWNPLDYLDQKETNGSFDKSKGPLLSVAIGLALRRLG